MVAGPSPRGIPSPFDQIEVDGLCCGRAGARAAFKGMRSPPDPFFRLACTPTAQRVGFGCRGLESLRVGGLATAFPEEEPGRFPLARGGCAQESSVPGLTAPHGSSA